jgi:hypothetical protein
VISGALIELDEGELDAVAGGFTFANTASGFPNSASGTLAAIFAVVATTVGGFALL